MTLSLYAKGGSTVCRSPVRPHGRHLGDGEGGGGGGSAVDPDTAFPPALADALEDARGGPQGAHR